MQMDWLEEEYFCGVHKRASDNWQNCVKASNQIRANPEIELKLGETLIELGHFSPQLVSHSQNLFRLLA